MNHLGRQMRPQHVQVLQPGKQLRVLRGRHGTRQALVHVMMCVDQTGRDHLAAHIQHLGLTLVHHAAVLLGQICRGANPQHGGAIGDQRTVANLAALRVHGDQYVGIQGYQGHGELPLKTINDCQSREEAWRAIAPNSAKHVHKKWTVNQYFLA